MLDNFFKDIRNFKRSNICLILTASQTEPKKYKAYDFEEQCHQFHMNLQVITNCTEVKIKASLGKDKSLRNCVCSPMDADKYNYHLRDWWSST